MVLATGQARWKKRDSRHRPAPELRPLLHGRPFHGCSPGAFRRRKAQSAQSRVSLPRRGNLATENTSHRENTSSAASCATSCAAFCATSCATSCGTFCAASFTCPSFTCHPRAAWGTVPRLTPLRSRLSRRPALPHLWQRTHRQTSRAIGNGPLCTSICPYPFFEVTPPGAVPGTGGVYNRTPECCIRPPKSLKTSLSATAHAGAFCSNENSTLVPVMC